ncbi:hypothetical protein [Muriicola sp.]|uniref:hypothetical protein n=1 Tax=Muriicola sp. TaxID=2020856 RepID=UPI003C7786A0
MKALFTLFLVLFFSAGVFAQKKEGHVKIENTQMDSLLDSRPADTVFSRKSKKDTPEKLARLYKFKNARIQKELAFKIKKQYHTV